ncbi:MAG: SH3 domain-containing protein [Anaerovoracaceae bacterium]
MKNKRISILVAICLLVSVFAPTAVFAGGDLSKSEIQKINNKFETPGTKIVRLEDVSSSMSKSKVLKEITSYKLTYKYTQKGTLSSSVKKYYEDKRNLSAIKSTVKPVYAFVTKPTDLRQFPTDDWAHMSYRYSTSDNFQECSLRIGEGVYIMHYSKDRKWAFVGTEYYMGWVKISDLGISTKEDVIKYTNADDFYMITRTSTGTLNKKKTTLLMGTKLQRNEDGNALYPARDTKGKAVLKSEKLSSKYEAHRGYLDFKRDTLVKQMKKFEGAAYGWGMDNLRQDCTSSVMSAYMTFGILIPRDTSCWVNIKGRVSLAGKSRGQKISAINKLSKGDLIYYRGHGMMFTGTKNGKPVITHQTYPKAKTEIMPDSLIDKTDYIYNVIGKK